MYSKITVNDACAVALELRGYRVWLQLRAYYLDPSFVLFVCQLLCRMASPGMLRRVALVRTDVSEEPNASFIRETRIGELGATLAVTSNRRTLRRKLQLALFLVHRFLSP
jgi:hypothetical protein